MKEKNNNAWWLRIRELAEEQGLNQEQLAQQSGVSLKTVQHLWNDPTANTRLSVLVKFATILKVKLTELIGASSEQEEEGL